MVDAAPGELADVDETISTSQVHKGPKVRQIAHHTTAHFAGLQLIEQLLTPPLTPFLDSQALRENQSIACAIDLNDLELQHLIFHRLQLGRCLLILATCRNLFPPEVHDL